MMQRSISPALILFWGILVQADGQTDRAYMVLQKQNLGKARAARWRHASLAYPFFSPHRRPEPNKRYRVTNVNGFITYLLCVCVCVSQLLWGVCLLCCCCSWLSWLCVCTSLTPDAKTLTCTEKAETSRKAAKHLDRVQLRKTAQLLLITRVRYNYTCNSLLSYRHAILHWFSYGTCFIHLICT